ncbi:MAG: hypothetical protein KF784_01790 [Fimbriimonadaceae bacterium]|nr:hypothetical protein [Fimbriimonadaceae bacterium]
MASRRPEFNQVDHPDAWKGAPSQYPFGRQVRIRKEQSRSSILCLNNYESIDVDIRGRLIVQGNSKGLSLLEDIDGDLAVAEGFAREALGRFAARRRDLNSHVNIAGQNIPSFSAKKTGARFLEVTAWAKARNVTLNRNDEAKRFSFTWKGKNCIMCWGTDQIKIGDSWRALPDVVMYDEGKLWIPLSAVES